MKLGRIKLRIKNEEESIKVQKYLISKRSEQERRYSNRIQSYNPYIYYHEGAITAARDKSLFEEGTTSYKEVSVSQLLGDDRMTKIKKELMGTK